MLFMSLIKWWYGDGWRRRVRKTGDHFEGTMDFFSFSLLLKTLFQPFRQISAGSVEGALDTKLRAFADKLIARFIGAGIRLVIMFVGLIVILLQAFVSIILLIGWAVVPALPIIGLVMVVIGWTL